MWAIQNKEGWFYCGTHLTRSIMIAEHVGDFFGISHGYGFLPLNQLQTKCWKKRYAMGDRCVKVELVPVNDK